jgi:hypothetical protein
MHIQAVVGIADFPVQPVKKSLSLVKISPQR